MIYFWPTFFVFNAREIPQEGNIPTLSIQPMLFLLSSVFFFSSAGDDIITTLPANWRVMVTATQRPHLSSVSLSWRK